MHLFSFVKPWGRGKGGRRRGSKKRTVGTVIVSDSPTLNFVWSRLNLVEMDPLTTQLDLKKKDECTLKTFIHNTRVV